MVKLLKLSLIISSISASILIGLFYFSSPGEAQTGSTDLSGYAWSDNIGWIDFDPAFGGVSADSSGYLTGYAWSDNIGWVKFGGLSSFPVGSGTASQNAQINSSNKLIGWARACGGMYDISLNQTAPNNTCSGSSRTDGWDGWISLGGTSPSYSISLSGQNFSGFAWGSDVVGWIDFGPAFGGVTVVATPITISPDADPSTVIVGNSSIISWSSTGADSCTVTKDGAPFATGISNVGISSGNLSVATTFEFQCINIGNSKTALLTVDVTLPPPPNPTLTFDCVPSQPGNAPGDVNMYVNRNTIWTISTTTAGTFSDVTWSGTNIPLPPAPPTTTTGNTLNKIYTTIGQKSIHAEATFTRSSDEQVFPSVCSTSTLIKLDIGTSGEV